MTAVGSLVLYKLSAPDAEAINRRRQDARAYRDMNQRVHSGGEGATGFVAHVGNDAREGATYPAVAVADFSGYGHLNLHVLLDGNDSYWATSRDEGDGPGQWLPVK